MTVRNLAVFCLSVLMVSSGSSRAWGQAEPVRVISPDGAVELVLTAASAGGPVDLPLRYRVGYRGQPVIVDSALGLDIEGQPPLPGRCKPVDIKASDGDETYLVPAGKCNPVRDHFRS